MDKSNSALNVLRAIRDEAHRFAISFNREIRLKKINQSILDEIDEIGTKRKLALLRTFKSINQLRHSSPQEIQKKTKIVGEKLAKKILEFLNRKSG